MRGITLANQIFPAFSANTTRVTAHKELRHIAKILLVAILSLPQIVHILLAEDKHQFLTICSIACNRLLLLHAPLIFLHVII